MSSDIIVIEKKLLKSKAFRSLNGNAKTIYFDFFMKRRITKTKARPGRKSERVILNNGEIEYCYSEAEKEGLTRPVFQRALDALIEKGLIDIAHLGLGGPARDKSKYAISNRWRAYDTPEFNRKIRQKDIRRGRGFAIYHKKKRANISNKNITSTSNEKVTP